MSSIFTFNPSPPKPASPWASNTPTNPTPFSPPRLSASVDPVEDDIPGHLRMSVNSGRVRSSYISAAADRAPAEIMTDSGETVTGLASEPQMGPTEYKLSLVAGGKSEARMEQLTTQLLWRLQQSTSYHGAALASKSPQVIASLLQESNGALYEIGVADNGDLLGLEERDLEESLDVLRTMAAKLGAVVTVVRKVAVNTITEEDIKRREKKLAQDREVRERYRQRSRSKKSAVHPRATGNMTPPSPQNGGYSSDEGPTVSEDSPLASVAAEKTRSSGPGITLWVAEALVKPYDGSGSDPTFADFHGNSGIMEKNNTEQLRISLTGPTMCGKSTLLGTLTTGELDNGRGKSRLSLLRHPHEFQSGVTSSVNSDLVGYKPKSQESDEDDESGFFGGATSSEDQDMGRVVNYATGNVSSHTDIHSTAEGGRIAYMFDSAGNLKYRRTTVRSLVGWAPHYAALLIPANDCDVNGNPGLSEASRVHMELCIKLNLRLIVIVTKMDLGSKTGVRRVLSPVLTALKSRERKPIIANDPDDVKNAIQGLTARPETVVPILLTSSVRGDGIDLVHLLLMDLPIPEPPVAPGLEPVVRPLPGTSLVATTEGIADLSIDSGIGTVHVKPRVADGVSEDLGDPELRTLFHVEDIFADKRPALVSLPGETEIGSVVSGHVRYGHVSMGDKLLIGPFAVGEVLHRSRSATPTPTTSSLHSNSVNLHPSSLLSRSPESGDEGRGRTRRSMQEDRQDSEVEWRLVKVVSIRRCRVPVMTLFAGEAATLGIIPVEDDPELAVNSGSFVDVKAGISMPNRRSSPLALSALNGAENASTVPSRPIDIEPQRSSTPDKKAVTFASPPQNTSTPPPELRLKKGMVIINRPPKGGELPKVHAGFVAVFDGDDTGLVVGSDVTVYIASVRAIARIVSVDPPLLAPGNSTNRIERHRESVGIFGFDEDSSDEGEESNGNVPLKRKFSFELLFRVEWVELGAKVLVMKSGAGMDVLVGRVVERIREGGS